ncbi:hypothetical protein B0H14DRAFT_2614050 [Mycena olivaceomarginata]|nr:hypothetical protein B0H14DRAFT_2614050 [Mycena olivaceomarginata]
MLRISGQDDYIYKPAMLDVDAVEFCIPIQWFTRGGEFFAKCWQMLPVLTDKGSGWRVFKSDNYKVPNVFDHATNQSAAWEYTNPVLGNRWRAKAKGSHVVIFPMWVYCDNTSGNASKQWNEHNSFLMTPVGLPREETQKEYNIHFLCTSNLAHPLEMLDGIVDQLELKETAFGFGILSSMSRFLLFQRFLALLGDNPMQSHDAMDGDNEDEPVREKAANADGKRSVAGSDAGSEQGSVAGSDNSAASA